MYYDSIATEGHNNIALGIALKCMLVSVLEKRWPLHQKVLHFIIILFVIKVNWVQRQTIDQNFES